MPASSSENLVHVEEKLRASFADGTKLDHLVASSSKQILLHKIDFKAAEKPYTLQLDTLKSKYIHLNPGQSATSNSTSNASKTGAMSVKEVGDGLPSPKVVLYPEEKVRLEWRKVHRVGSGLHNMGNTCFLNSTLQCLTYTAPLVNFCLSEEHSSICKQQGFCMMCELQRHIRRCYNNNGHAIKPQVILQKLKMIAKHMHWGRQEDAHEFLRYVVDGLQKACLHGFTKLDKFSKETTVVNQIFGGFLRSQVQCLRCKERSNTYDPVMDISLDIKNVQSVERAFEKFVQPETLDNENAYMCPRCKQKVSAQKRLSIHKPPNVLTLQLKRFDINRMFGKISRNIQFQDILNVRPYMSNRQGEPVLYQLYAVLVHSGSACNMGHYYCYVKSSSQTWYCMNDAMVQQVNAGRVFNAEAYLLFYTRTRSTNNNINNNNNAPRLKGTIIGPQLPQRPNHKHVSSLNNKISVPSKDTGTAVSRKEPFKLALPVIHTDELKKKCTINPTSIPPPEKRSKISFGIRLGTSGKEAATGSREQENSGEDTQNKPRIVMQIKHGKVTTFETSPNGKAKIMESDMKVKPKRLVPYGEDSDSEVESKSVKGGLNEERLLNGSRKDHPSLKPSTLTSGGGVHSSVIFDEKLNATMSVPGNSNLLETTREKFNSNHQKKSIETGCNGTSSFIKSGKDSNSLKSKDLTLKLHSRPMPSSQSPTKQLTPGGLTCLTSPTNSKVNSTTSWQVQCQESVMSPTLGSTSSSGSVNSTTDWKIKEQTVSAKCERVLESPGWTVTADSKKAFSDKDNSQKLSPKSNLTSDTDLIPNKLEIQNLRSVDTKETLSKPDPHKPSACGDFNHPRAVLSPPQTETVEISDTQPLLNGFLDSDDERIARKKHKKAKKHKKRKIEEICEHDYQKPSDESPTKKSKKKKKKHKHRHEREHDHGHHNRGLDYVHSSKEVDSEHEDSPEYEWVEKPAVQQKMDTTKQHSAPAIQHKLDITSPKKPSATDITPPQNHSTEDTSTNTCKLGVADITSPKRPSQAAVQPPSVKHTESASKCSVTKTVPVKQWDECVRDPHKATNGHNGKMVKGSSWDGAKSSSVVAELEKHSSSRGYGASVLSWEGDKSHVDKAEEREDRKREWSDEYEEDIDSGKMKKVKKNQSDFVVMGFGANPFQKHQDDKNKEKNLMKSYSQGHIIDVSNRASGHDEGHHGASGLHGLHNWYNGGASQHSDHHYHSNHDSHHHDSNKHASH